MIEEVLNDKLELNNDLTVIDFYATWCGPCKILSEIIDKINNQNPSISFKKINVDKNEILCDKYHVTNLPCLICFKNGEEYWRHIGLLTQKQLEEKINA